MNEQPHAQHDPADRGLDQQPATAYVRRLLRTYADRRSPWGPPWWVYGVAFAVANLGRQGVLLAYPELPTLARVASWAATLALVFVAVTGVAGLVRRPGGARSGPPAPDRVVHGPATPDPEPDEAPLEPQLAACSSSADA